MIINPKTAKNPKISGKQKRFEKWAKLHKLNLDRNWYVPCHDAPYTYEELFTEITAKDYYMENKTQGAWDAWRWMKK